MKSFFSAATAFYMLSEGERLNERALNPDYNRMYVIWPAGGGWKVRHKWVRDWEAITDNIFKSENEAFNFAYSHLLSDRS